MYTAPMSKLCECFKQAGYSSIQMCPKHSDEFTLYRMAVIRAEGNWHTNKVLNAAEWFRRQYLVEYAL